MNRKLSDNVRELRDCDCGVDWEGAVARGDLATLEQAASHSCPLMLWGRDPYRRAVVFGRLDVVEWLHARGYRPHSRSGVYAVAASQGDHRVLEWMWAKGVKGGWDSDVCRAAAANGQLRALKWLRSRCPPCPWAEDTCEAAASRGDLEALEWVRAQDPPCPWDAGACEAAARRSDRRALEWLRAQDPPCPWSAQACSGAASSGRLETLKWLRAQSPPCPLNEDAGFAAARRGDWETLEWLRAQNLPCPWGEELVRLAAAAGRLELVRWLRAQRPPCPWDETATAAAAEYGQLEALHWLVAAGCPWDPARCRSEAASALERVWPNHEYAAVVAWVDHHEGLGAPKSSAPRGRGLGPEARSQHRRRQPQIWTAEVRGWQAERALVFGSHGSAITFETGADGLIRYRLVLAGRGDCAGGTVEERSGGRAGFVPAAGALVSAAEIRRLFRKGGRLVVSRGAGLGAS